MVAVIVAVWLDVTPTVETVNVAVVAPEATTTDAGTVAAALSEASVTVIPPTGAGLLIVTVPVELTPPRTDVGFKESADATGALTVRLADATVAVVGTVALIEAVLSVLTPTVVTVKVVEVKPAPIETVAGTVAEASVELSVTVIVLPVATLPINVTVAVEDVPPFTDVGLRVTVPMIGGSTEQRAVNDVPPDAAVSVTAWVAVTGVDDTEKVAELEPAGIVTVAGTVRAELLDEILTVTPPAGAGLLRVNVPTGLLPPTIDFVFNVNAVNV